ncbi:MAG TPA: Fe-S cluster assembly protein SufB, partial [Acidimicrobiales bacterium]|nr:Fe-S cluster assembly protein SufB [Acidimicrobiales bacterium]
MNEAVKEIIDREYAYGFHTDLDTEVAPKGLDEDIVRFISARKDEPRWLLEWRLSAYRHFITLDEPTWPRLDIAPIDYQDMHYWAAPKEKGPAPESLDDIDPEVRAMFDKLGI